VKSEHVPFINAGSLKLLVEIIRNKSSNLNGVCVCVCVCVIQYANQEKHYNHLENGNQTL
jgi:hypothetical protein